jgi:excisionase family DNA binding protein
MTDRAMSLSEVAGRLGVSVRTVRRMIEEGEIRAFKVLGQWRILESELDRIIRGETPDSEKSSQ